MCFKTKNLLNEYLKILNTDISLTLLDKFERIYKLLESKRKEQKRIKRFGLTSLKNIQLVQNITELPVEKVHLLSLCERVSSVNLPEIFELENEKPGGLRASVLNIELYLLNDVYGYSKSTLISDGKSAFSQLLFNFHPKYDFKNGLQQSISSLAMKKININFKKMQNLDNIIGIHLLNEHSKNYYHWLYEVIPKLILINNYIINDEYYKNQRYVLIVDENLFKQMFEIINLIVKFEYQINEIDDLNGIHCKQLIYCTDFWISQDNTRFKPNVVEEFFVDKYAVQLVLNSLKQYKSSIVPSRRIYLQRKGARQLINQKEIETVLKNFEFEFVNVSSLSFLEQIKLFSEASTVVGASGAAFSNIVFMNTLSKAIIFTPNCIATNMYVFQQMADVAEIDLVHILSENRLKSIHGNLLISKYKLKKILENIFSRD